MPDKPKTLDDDFQRYNIIIASLDVLNTHEESDSHRIMVNNFSTILKSMREDDDLNEKLRIHFVKTDAFWDPIIEAGQADVRVKGMVELLERGAFKGMELKDLDRRAETALGLLEEVVEEMKTDWGSGNRGT
ncbi:hypothetical protein MMC12_008208 [Toensbergia leucococca]|nr:hypothetical protein [Toensbergia leucococca]